MIKYGNRFIKIKAFKKNIENGGRPAIEINNKLIQIKDFAEL